MSVNRGTGVTNVTTTTVSQKENSKTAANTKEHPGGCKKFT
jgi:hypothetical protein